MLASGSLGQMYFCPSELATLKVESLQRNGEVFL